MIPTSERRYANPLASAKATHPEAYGSTVGPAARPAGCLPSEVVAAARYTLEGHARGKVVVTV
jgi:hypothetical protein